MIIEKEKIIIRNAEEGDAEKLCSWWNDGSIMSAIGMPLGLNTTSESVIKKINNSEAEKLHIFMILYDNIPAGEMNYREKDVNSCLIGIKICDPKMQNKGLGKVALSILIEHIFEKEGFETIIANMDLRNKKAQRAFEKLGFNKKSTDINSWMDQMGNMQSSVTYTLNKENFISYADNIL